MNRPEWLKRLKKYQQPSVKKATIELLTSIVPFILLLIGMIIMLKYGLPYWSIIPIVPITAGFMVRTFIILHDCGHNSFFKSKKANTVVGHILGVFTFTTFQEWQSGHNIHHGSVVNLDNRKGGDVWTITAQEYKNMSNLNKVLYRIFRHPLFLFTIAPPFSFIILNRFPSQTTSKKAIPSFIITNLFIIGIILAFIFTIGIQYYLMVYLPVIVIASISGVWLFYIQHQFKDVYWFKDEEWDIVNASLYGSSFYKLPSVLRWFTGNIGFHHIHHLNPRIPEYNLKECYDNVPEVQNIKPVTLVSSLKSLFLRFWDEKAKQLISVKTYKVRLAMNMI
jgi:omega-6 fatty acid desaturase (delta-12 desaturase)